MSNGQAMEYARAHPDVDRIRLVSSLTVATEGGKFERLLPCS